MPDNQKYHEQLIDQGWERMSALLDKEMPVGRRDRKLIWWLSATGVLLILSLWGYYAAVNTDKQSPQETPIVQDDTRAIVSVESEQAAGNDIAANDAQPIVNLEASAEFNSVDNGEEIRSDKTARLTESKDSKGRDRGLTEEARAPQVTDLDGRILEAKPGTQNMTSTNSTKAEPMSNTISQQMNLIEDAAVPIIQLEELVDPNMSTDSREQFSFGTIQMPIAREYKTKERALAIIPAHARKKHGVGLELFAASHVNSDGNPFYGIETGAGAIFRTHARLQVHTGISYGYYNVDGLGVFGLSKNSDEEALGSNQGGPYTGVEFDVQDVYSNSLPYSEAKILTEKFHYLHLPVKAEYRITPRFSVTAGVKASMLIAAPARFGLNDTRFSSTQPAALSGSKSFLYNYDILKKYDIAPMVGVGYVIGSRWSLSLTYSRGLIHYINTSESADRTDVHRSGSIGIGYRLF